VRRKREAWNVGSNWRAKTKGMKATKPRTTEERQRKVRRGGWIARNSGGEGASGGI